MEEGRKGRRVAAPSPRVQVASSSGFESRLRNADELLKRFFPAVPSLCRVQVPPRRGNGSCRGKAEGYESGFGIT